MPDRGRVRAWSIPAPRAMALVCLLALFRGTALVRTTPVLAESPPRLPEGEGKQIVAQVCGSCHSLEIVTSKKWSRQQWDDSVQAMIGRGAPVSKAEVSNVVNYLSRNFGTVDRAKTLFVDICSSCHTLARISEQELTREEWREETQGMISEGAAISDEELDLLLDYLAKNFGKRPESSGVSSGEKEVK
jgi:mono/diheme cytochrome c family protein